MSQSLAQKIEWSSLEDFDTHTIKHKATLRIVAQAEMSKDLHDAAKNRGAELEIKRQLVSQVEGQIAELCGVGKHVIPDEVRGDMDRAMRDMAMSPGRAFVREGANQGNKDQAVKILLEAVSGFLQEDPGSPREIAKAQGHLKAAYDAYQEVVTGKIDDTALDYLLEEGMIDQEQHDKLAHPNKGASGTLLARDESPIPRDQWESEFLEAVRDIEMNRVLNGFIVAVFNTQADIAHLARELGEQRWWGFHHDSINDGEYRGVRFRFFTLDDLQFGNHHGIVSPTHLLDCTYGRNVIDSPGLFGEIAVLRSRVQRVCLRETETDRINTREVRLRTFYDVARNGHMIRFTIQGENELHYAQAQLSDRDCQVLLETGIRPDDQEPLIIELEEPLRSQRDLQIWSRRWLGENVFSRSRATPVSARRYG